MSSRHVFPRQRVRQWRRISSLVALISAFSFSLPSAHAAGGADDIPPEFRASVERAVDYLQKSFAAKEIPEDGRLIITGLALLKSGIPPETPIIQAAISNAAGKAGNNKFGAAEQKKDVYEAGVALMLLEAADHGQGKYLPQMESIANYIIGRQAAHGAWDYSGDEADAGDTSMTQYALLGLWSAHKAGVPINPKVWDDAARWHINTQYPDGGFTYHPQPVTSGPSHTMTVSGICNLLVIRRHLYPEAPGKWGNQSENKSKEDRANRKFGVLEEVDAAGTELEQLEVEEAEELSDVEKSEREKAIAAMKDYTPTVPLAAIDKSITGGMGWLNRKWRVSQVGLYAYYYLYSMERLAALGDMDLVVGHDWYMEGGSVLLNTQNPDDGFWKEAHSGEAAATAFGIMFLTKATAQSLGKVPVFGLDAGLLVGDRGLMNRNKDKSEDDKEVEEKKKLPVEELLTTLMTSANPEDIGATQVALVDKVLFEDQSREALIAQKDLLLKMAADPRPDVKKIAYWALGRTEDYAVIPVLIDGLLVDNVDANVEALLSLCFMTRKPNGLSEKDVSPDTLLDPTLEGEARLQAVNQWREETYRRWKKWYFTIRPYSQRDDIEEALRIR